MECRNSRDFCLFEKSSGFMLTEDDDDVTRLRRREPKPKLNWCPCRMAYWRKQSDKTTSRLWMSTRPAELKMGSDQYRSPCKIICVLCEKSDENEITGPLSSKQNISAHQNCLVSSLCFQRLPYRNVLLMLFGKAYCRSYFVLRGFPKDWVRACVYCVLSCLHQVSTASTRPPMTTCLDLQ